MASGGQRWRGPCEEGPPETEHSSLTTLWVSQMTFGSLHRTWSGGASPCMPTGAPGNTRANVVPRARPAQALRRREATHPARHADAGTSGGARPLPGGSSKGGRRKASGSARSTEPGVRGVVLTAPDGNTRVGRRRKRVSPGVTSGPPCHLGGGKVAVSSAEGRW